MKYTVEVDRNVCIGCGICYGVDPGHFETDDNGKSKVRWGKGEDVSTNSFDDDLINDVKRAVSSCPVTAITLKT